MLPTRFLLKWALPKAEGGRERGRADGRQRGLSGCFLRIGGLCSAFPPKSSHLQFGRQTRLPFTPTRSALLEGAGRPGKGRPFPIATRPPGRRGRKPGTRRTRGRSLSVPAGAGGPSPRPSPGAELRPRCVARHVIKCGECDDAPSRAFRGAGSVVPCHRPVLPFSLFHACYPPYYSRRII